jgi:2-polyprenyl-3-methyl-5-hydroxy-6-metoxy-1,4-benzoquinol methylase
MKESEIRERKASIETSFGPWTAANIHLGYGIETTPQRACPHLLLRRATQTIADLSAKSWDQLRILDLGSLEGFYTLEFASHGAQVVGIEGRESNNAHARFAAEVLGLSNIEFITDDVRNLCQEKYGRFDVVFCSGILYHLPGVDACRFLTSIAQVCKRLTIIDTHVGLSNEDSISWKGSSYQGFLFTEHSTNDTEDVKSSRKWASLDNNTSFWFTKPSLLNLLRDVGFTSAFEVLRPKSFEDYSDRLTFAAIIGEHQRCYMSPELEKTPEHDWPEHSNVTPFPAQLGDLTPNLPLWRRIAGLRHKVGI